MKISATDPDWSREDTVHFWNPGAKLLRTLRDYEALEGKPLGRLRRKVVALRHRFWSVVTGADMHFGTQIGGGLKLPHPNGVVIHPASRIGPNCILFQQVTLGANRGNPGAPTLGGHVDVGPGARILGPVVIGDHAVIGANAVVISDVPAGGIAVGVPARVIRIEDVT